MPGDKTLLSAIQIRSSGKLHHCRRDKSHLLAKGQPVFIVREDRDERHYCVPCGKRFIMKARLVLDDLSGQIDQLG